MPAKSKRIILARIDRYLPTIGECITRAWQDYLNYPFELRMQHSARSRASLVHDHMVTRIRNAFDVFSDVRMLEIQKLFILALPDDVAIRFKKLNDEMRSSGIPTQQRLDFDAQEDLPGIESVTHLEAGYRLNELQTRLDGVYVTLPFKGQILWVHEIPIDEQDDGDANVIVLPNAPTPPSGGGTIAPRSDDSQGGIEDESS